MKTLVLTTLALVLSVSVCLGQAETGAISYQELSYQFLGTGARAMAMGDAFVGLANDVSGGSWNPAGIYLLEKAIISGSYNSFNPDGEMSEAWPLWEIRHSTTSNLKINSIGGFSLAVPARIKGHPWVFNIQYSRNNERSFNTTFKGNLESGLDPDSYDEDISYLQGYGFGATTRLYKQLSFGFLINVYDGRRLKVSQSADVRDSIMNPVYPDITMEVYRSFRFEDTTYSNGVNFTLGLMYKLEKFSLGAVLRTPFVMMNNTDRYYYASTTYNGLPSVNETFNIIWADSLAKQDIPLAFAFGVGITPTEDLTFVIDADYCQYGQANWYYRDSTRFDAGGAREDFYTKQPIDWNNTFGIGGGAEYVISTSAGRIPLRAGFRHNQLASPKNLAQVLIPILDDDGYIDGFISNFTASERQSNFSFSFGSGIHWSRVYLDFSYRRTTGGDRSINYYMRDLDTDVLLTTRDIKGKAQEFRFTLTGFIN